MGDKVLAGIGEILLDADEAGKGKTSKGEGTGGFGDLFEGGGGEVRLAGAADVFTDGGDGSGDAIEVSGFEGGGATEGGVVEVITVFEGVEVAGLGTSESFLVSAGEGHI